VPFSRDRFEENFAADDLNPKPVDAHVNYAVIDISDMSKIPLGTRPNPKLDRAVLEPKALQKSAHIA
jgi:hypothetical protein